MEEQKKKDWEEFFSFIKEVLDDSPHSGNNETYEWASDKIQALEEMVFDA